MPTGSETHELLFSSHAPFECDIYSAERSTNYEELNGRQKIFETSTLDQRSYNNSLKITVYLIQP